MTKNAGEALKKMRTEVEELSKGMEEAIADATLRIHERCMSGDEVTAAKARLMKLVFPALLAFSSDEHRRRTAPHVIAEAMARAAAHLLHATGAYAKKGYEKEVVEMTSIIALGDAIDMIPPSLAARTARSGSRSK